ncbi:AAA family ATPase [Microbispora sp. NEAU-D428]|uniref:BTAD domain-containing putative transcriptional regulator n=1 Tax=Microbispora sitophila TaxID=2771537 RepID=UPI00186835D8|nr:BTAD domain-containing putative transcriptional regulator [Microbispora sitophila]MBE3010077.1 AAA family ATPase [Microbispora sitophila]
MNSLSFRLLGPFEVTGGDGRVIDLGPRKQRAVLAVLALEPGRIVSLDRLIDELWADEPPSSATATLQSYVSNLRKVLEPGRRPRTPPAVLLTREPGYLLSVAPGQVDLARFVSWVEDGRRALARREYAEVLKLIDRALETWRGEPLAEFAAYEFAQPVIARLAELRAVAVEDRFEARLAMGDGPSCVADLERLVEAYPYRERLWSLLVLALYRSGRQTDALGALRRVRALLDEEMGLQPGPELRRLEQAVLEQSPALDAPAPLEAPVVARPAAAPQTDAPEETTPSLPAAEPPPSAALVARENELVRLGERLGAVRRGRGGVLLVTGEAGIGKTRLAQLAAEEAEARGVAVVWGRCVEAEAAPPFWPWLQALRELGDRGRAAARLLAGEGGAAADPEAALFELYEGVLAALARSGTPTLVVLDDLHAADAASLRLLAFLAAELHRRPVLVLATVRPEPGREPERLRDTLAALTREPGTERLALAPFTAEEVGAFLRRHDLTDPALAEVLYRRTGGNPFYLGELLRLLGSEQRLGAASLGVPEGVLEVIERRVARLPDPTRDLLRRAAVLGRDVSLDVLEALTETPAEEVMSLLEPAVAVGILAEAPGGFDYRFSHALVRDALYAGLGRLEKARLHLSVAEALESLPTALAASLPGGDGTARLPVLAHHFAMAARVGGADKAVGYAAGAARQATAQRAYDEAVELWDKALLALGARDPARRCRLLIELGRSLRVTGDAARARAALEEAIGLAEDTGDRVALVEAVAVFGTLSVWNWRSYGVVDDHTIALLENLLAGPLDDAHRAALLGTLGIELNYGPRRAEGEAMVAEAVEIARRIGDPALLLQVLNNYMIASWVPERENERRRAAEEMLAVPDLPAAAEIVGRVHRMACLFRAGELAEWDRDLARAEHLLQEVRRSELTAMVRIAQAARLTVEGRWDEVERLAGELGEVFGESSMWGLGVVRPTMLYACRRGQGRVAEILEEVITAASQPHNDPLRPIAVLAALDVGDRELAGNLIARWGTTIPDDWSGEFVAVIWSYVAAQLGVPDPSGLYARLAPYADRLALHGSGTAGWGSIHQALAMLSAAMGDRERALDHARRAHEIHLRLGLDHWAEQSARLLAELRP